MDEFQSQTRSRSTCDSDATVTGQLLDMFQSQTRSRSTCDEEKERMELTWKTNVSISDEKPLHMRLTPGAWQGFHCIVSISDEKPLHMRLSNQASFSGTGNKFQSQTRSRSTCDREAVPRPISGMKRFNLRREAAPHATTIEADSTPESDQFQSQTRSRSTCDHAEAVIGAARKGD